MAKGSQVFTVLVVGENPQELLKKYNMNLEVEQYVKYKYLDAKKMKDNSTKIMEEIIASPKKFNLNDYFLDALKDRLRTLKEMTDFEYYQELTKGLFYDENGDALSTENPNGKWQTATLGKNFSLPLILKDGSQAHEGRANKVDWDAMHMNNTHVYEILWAMVKGGRTPSNEHERTLYENMKDNTNYFNKFKNVDDYVVHNCAYWNYAYLDENGWKDIDDGGKDTEWIATYFDKFIEPIRNKDVKVSVFECTKGKED